MTQFLKRIAIVTLAVLMCLTGLSVKAQAEDTAIATALYMEDNIVPLNGTIWIDFWLDPWDKDVSRELKWESADESIATVDDRGNVTGHKPGDVKIYATTTDGSNIKAECNVWVLNEESAAYAVLMDNGDFVFLRSFEEPANYGDGQEIKDIKGNTYKGKVFSYIERKYANEWTYAEGINDKIKKAYVAEGSTIYLLDMQNFFYNCVNMTEVNFNGFNTERVERFDHMFARCGSLEKIDMSGVSMKSVEGYYNMFGECDSLTEIILGTELNAWALMELPAGKWTRGTESYLAYDIAIEYSSHPEDLAGTWTRKLVPATAIKFEYDEYEVWCPNYGTELKVIFTPEDATSPLEWKSSDETIAKAYSSGEVVGYKPGTVTITVRTTDGTNLSATCTVNVVPRPEPVYLQRFKFTKKEYEVPVNSHLVLEYEVTPEGAEIEDLFWESSDESIAEVYGGVVYPYNMGTVTITGRNGDGTIKDTCTVTITEAVEKYYAYRVSGSNRYKTSLEIATVFCEWWDETKVENIILAFGGNFADALAGSYLAAVKKAPIVIINDRNIDLVKKHVQKYLDEKGTIYILGGTAAVSDKVEKEMKKITKNVKRLAGSNRYGTNLAILNEAGMNSDTILVATGGNFADSLSASATGYPMLLVKDALTAEQKAFLKKNSDKKIYILGGTNAVSSTVEKELNAYGKVRRLAGASRFETSVLIAEKFFENPYGAVVAYSNDYPDGLCGGPLGYKEGIPLLLTRSDKLDAARKYIKDNGIMMLDVLGGEARLTNKDIKKLFGNKEVNYYHEEYKD
ncbi:MAG: BspA family leucine-rich repeat surface protein [Erysipelotrichaceae bacterium]|nr:BspA family leucine-rich repeat surface protein [Erysipelotrichaceae bacterium]